MLKIEVDKMSVQEACDFAMSKITEQGSQCTNLSGSCLYSNKGKHCSVGWLLDENNPELMQYSGTVNGLVYTFPDAVPELLKKNINLFRSLQELHDTSSIQGRKKAIHMLAKFIDTTVEPHWNNWVTNNDYYK